VHDYLIAWDAGRMAQWLPGWAPQRIFLLHHGANLLLLAMGGLLTVRFIDALTGLEELNHTLEARVSDRERHLAANFARMTALQQQHAAAQERQLIMQEIHDGLGSRLFTSLSRVERGDMGSAQVADTLRDCIGDMRLALDALTPGEDDFRVVLGNFLFRWQAQLEDAHVRSTWTINWPDGAPSPPPQDVLQLLRIAQEALTNVLKHAHATRVRVALRHRGPGLELEVEDDGRTPVPTTVRVGGRGLANMQARARQLGGALSVERVQQGTRVLLRVPGSAPEPAAPAAPSKHAGAANAIA
jgi:signal transduction histidine kinase